MTKRDIHKLSYLFIRAPDRELDLVHVRLVVLVLKLQVVAGPDLHRGLLQLDDVAGHLVVLR